MIYLFNCPFTTADVKLQYGKQQQTRLISGNGEKNPGNITSFPSVVHFNICPISSRLGNMILFHFLSPSRKSFHEDGHL